MGKGVGLKIGRLVGVDEGIALGRGVGVGKEVGCGIGCGDGLLGHALILSGAVPLLIDTPLLSYLYY